MTSFLRRTAESYLVVVEGEENSQIMHAAGPPRQQASYSTSTTKMVGLVGAQRLARVAVVTAVATRAPPPKPNFEKWRSGALQGLLL